MQDTFLRAARAPAAVPVGERAEEAWLVRVLVNLCRDKWRQTKTRERLRLRQGYSGHVDRSTGAPIVEAANPEAALVARSLVWRALAALDPRRRAVIVMHELEGTPVETIAKMLGVTSVTVRWHLSKGRRQLAAVLRGEGSTS